jgi:hypothetical protein
MKTRNDNKIAVTTTTMILANCDIEVSDGIQINYPLIGCIVMIALMVVGALI